MKAESPPPPRMFIYQPCCIFKGYGCSRTSGHKSSVCPATAWAPMEAHLISVVTGPCSHTSSWSLCSRTCYPQPVGTIRRPMLSTVHQTGSGSDLPVSTCSPGAHGDFPQLPSGRPPALSSGHPAWQTPCVLALWGLLPPRLLFRSLWLLGEGPQN